MNLAGGRGVGSMSLSRSAASSDEFPVGLRVLVVDDDATCLKILERMLITCRYDVTKCNRVEYALNELRRNKDGFDVVISDVHMPNMDGFKLLEYVGLEMDLPVIMMSADDSKKVVMKGVKHGACDYLIKPVRMEALKNIWQHVVRKKKIMDREHKYYDANEEDEWKRSKRKGDEDEGEDKNDYAFSKKARIVWSVELHQQFVAAVNQLGIDKAVPKRILELMNVPGLTRENVASHLQKYRMCLRKLIGEAQYIGGYETVVGGGFNLQTFTGYQPALGGSTVNSGISSGIYYQRPQSNMHGTEQVSHSNYSSLRQIVPPQPLLSTGERFAEIDPNFDLFNHELSHQEPQDLRIASSSVGGLGHTSTSVDNVASVNQNQGYSTAVVLVQQGADILGSNTLPVDIVPSSSETIQELPTSASNHLPFQFEQDDLLSVMLKQQEEDIGTIQGEFNFDFYALDDIL